MTSVEPPSGNASSESARAAQLVLSLSLGRVSVDARADTDWQLALDLAVQERCAALAWLRGRTAILRAAPEAVAAEWRKRAVAAGRYAEVQLKALADAMGLLEQHGLRPIVLKGLPLSSKLYGDPAARMTADLDIHVEPAEYAASSALLGTSGWRRFEGEEPWTLTYVRDHGAFPLYLELHSSLWCWNNLHLPPLVPDFTMEVVEGVPLRMHSGPSLPVYLAAHLSKHMVPALIWFVDFHEVWAHLAPDEREAVRTVARQSRAEGYLDWALGRVASLDLVSAEPSVDGLARLGFRGRTRQERHPLVREWRTAATFPDALRVLVTWLRPPQQRSLRALSATWTRRMRVLLGRERARAREYISGADDPGAPGPRTN